MSSIDERIVEMKFNNGDFQKGIDQTTNSLEKLETALNIENSAQSLDKISSRVSAMGVIGATALTRLADVAIDTGAKIYESTVGQIIKGGEQRSQNFAQAEFQLKGLGVTGEKLTQVMDAANWAVQGTAYGLDEAAIAASSFVASQVPLEQLPSSLRGISGVAAMTGRSFSDISQIFTTVAGNGRLMASELNRIGQSGVNAAAALAKSLGVTEEEVRDMTSKGKISFETFAKAMDDAFGEHATKANDIYSGSLSNMRAALSRLGEPLADGKFEKLRLIFNSLTPVIDNVKKSMMPLLETIRDMRIATGKRIAGFLDGIASDAGWKTLPTFFKGLGDAMLKLQQIGLKFAKIFGEVWAKAFGKGSDAMGKAGDKANQTKTAFETFVDFLIKGIDHVNNFLDSFLKAEGVFGTFRTVITAIIQPISTVWTILKGLGQIAGAIIGAIAEVGLAIWNLINPFSEISNMKFDMSGGIGGFFEWVRDKIESAVPVIAGGGR